MKKIFLILCAIGIAPHVNGGLFPSLKQYEVSWHVYRQFFDNGRGIKGSYEAYEKMYKDPDLVKIMEDKSGKMQWTPTKFDNKISANKNCITDIIDIIKGALIPQVKEIRDRLKQCAKLDGPAHSTLVLFALGNTMEKFNDMMEILKNTMELIGKVEPHSNNKQQEADDCIKKADSALNKLNDYLSNLQKLINNKEEQKVSAEFSKFIDSISECIIDDKSEYRTTTTRHKFALTIVNAIRLLQLAMNVLMTTLDAYQSKSGYVNFDVIKPELKKIQKILEKSDTQESKTYEESDNKHDMPSVLKDVRKFLDNTK
jgi:hypothetical protein